MCVRSAGTGLDADFADLSQARSAYMDETIEPMLGTEIDTTAVGITTEESSTPVESVPTEE